jgi:hypothetical protein
MYYELPPNSSTQQNRRRASGFAFEGQVVDEAKKESANKRHPKQQGQEGPGGCKNSRKSTSGSDSRLVPSNTRYPLKRLGYEARD